MGTVVITASGFSNLGTTAPSNWPSQYTWLSGQSPNGTKTYTVSDADWLSLLTWQAANLPDGTAQPTAAQLLLDWIQGTLVTPTIAGVQKFFTPAPTPPTVPPAISIQ